MKLRELFLKRAYEELMDFKSGLLGKDKESIYAEAYKIDSYTTLYEALVENIDDIQLSVMFSLVNQTGKILESLLNDYCSLYGDQYPNMQNFIKNMEEVA